MGRLLSSTARSVVFSMVRIMKKYSYRTPNQNFLNTSKVFGL